MSRRSWRRLIGLPWDDEMPPARPEGILAGMVGVQDADGSVVVTTTEPNLYGHGATGAAALLDYADSLGEWQAIEAGDAFETKAQMRARLAACRGEVGDGPDDDYAIYLSEWTG